MNEKSYIDITPPRDRLLGDVLSPVVSNEVMEELWD